MDATFATPHPLVPFERYMLVDDRARHPMTFSARFVFSGSVDEELLELAFSQALGRHPLLRSRVTGEGRRAAWVPCDGGSEEASDAIAACRLDAGAVVPRRLDLRAQLPMAWSWRSLPSGGVLQSCFHHAAVDGIGAFQFVGDWLEIYDALVTGRPPALRRLDPETLEGRGAAGSWRDAAEGQAASEPSNVNLPLGDIAGEFSRFFLRKITPLRLPSEPTEERARCEGVVGDESSEDPLGFQASAPDLCQLSLDREMSRRLRVRAEQSGATLNDWAMRDLLLALFRHNEAAGAAGQWYRVTMPVNLRSRRQLRMPSANRIGYAFLDRDMGDGAGRSELLESIVRENTAIRNLGLSAMFLKVLGGASKVPLGMRMLTLPVGTASTTVFSNVGDLTRRFTTKPRTEEGRVLAGDLRLERFSAAPPTRPGTPLTFLLGQYAGRIDLNAGFHPAEVPASIANQLLARWRDELEESLA